MKYDAGRVRVKTTVWGSAGSTATPESAVLFWYAAIAEADLGSTLAKPVQKASRPAMRAWKSGSPPNGWAGLHVRLTPRTMSAAVT